MTQLDRGLRMDKYRYSNYYRPSMILSLYLSFPLLLMLKLMIVDCIQPQGFNIAIKDELLDTHDYSKLSVSRTVDPPIHHLMDWYEFCPDNSPYNRYNIMATVALESRRLGKYSSKQMQANEALDVVGLEFHRIEQIISCIRESAQVQVLYYQNSST